MKRYVALILSLVWLLPLFACANDEPVSETRAEYGTARFHAVGDIFLTDAMLSDAKSQNNGYDFSPQFEDVIVALSKADLTMGNFEGNFVDGDYGRESGSYPVELAEELYQIGFDLLQTANSYSIYNGLSGLESTKAAIENNGMCALGTYVSAEDRNQNQVVIRDVNGIRFAFVAFTKGLGGLTMPSDTQCGVDLLYEDYTSDYSIVNESYITSVLQRAKDAQPDVIIAGVHWGSENQEEISQSQEQIANLMLRNGVDVIVGSHSHFPGKIERRSVTMQDGTIKDCVIAYSLGDFCAAEEGECNTSMILDLEFTRHAEATTITKVDYIPISTIDRGSEFRSRYCVMATQTEVELYESHYFDSVSDQLYEHMISDLNVLRKRVGIEE